MEGVSFYKSSTVEEVNRKRYLKMVQTPKTVPARTTGTPPAAG